MATSKGSSATSAEGEIKVTKKSLDEFNQMRAEQRNISQKMIEIESDMNEHRMVLDVLRKAQGDRRCYRMIGGVLMEQKAKEVIVDLEENNSKMQKTIDSYQDKVNQKAQEITDFAKLNGLSSVIRKINQPEVKQPASATK